MVLFVDDDDDYREAVVENAERIRISGPGCPRGRGARGPRTERPSLVLSDLFMSGMGRQGGSSCGPSEQVPIRLSCSSRERVLDARRHQRRVWCSRRYDQLLASSLTLLLSGAFAVNDDIGVALIRNDELESERA